ncbi:SBBP repeat-containing protein [Leptospira jelokensis]|uniref:SBBP repeat-containing protein n=1 Tax=Leptospira jelokensis TaxID=2484931 RepID=UPI001FD39803|nr:SBBP repeat-containing protein [Leptospira jelokensis]
MKESKMIRNIKIVLFLTLAQVLFSHCYPLSLNNPSDFQSKAYAETQILKCMLNDWDCIEFPQDNQGIKQWSKIIGQSGAFESYGNSTAVDRKGNVYMIGTTTGSVLDQIKISPTDYSDIFLIKFQSDGQLVWAKHMGSPVITSTYAEFIHIDSFGNLYLIGTSNSPFNELGAIGSGALLIKLGNDGTTLWTRIVPTAGETLGYGVTTDPIGNVYITGNTEEQTLNGQSATGGRNTFLLKYDIHGNLLWTKLFDSSGIASYGQSVQYEPTSNSLILSGQLVGSGTFFSNTTLGDSTDSYILSFDLNGNFQWVQFLGGIGISTQIRAMSLDKKGSIYVSGDTNGSIEGQTKEGSIVQFLTKISSNGDKIWTKLLGGGGSSSTYANAIYADNTGHIYTYGGTNGNLPGVNRIGTNDAHLTKYDASGNLIWIRLSGNSGINLTGRGLSSDRYGTLYATGFTSGGFDGESKFGSIDAFLIQYK